MAENAVMDKAGELLGKKYGPLPFGAWLGVIAVAGFVGKRFIASNKTANAAQSQEGYVVDSSGNKLASAYTGTAGGGTPFGTGVLTSASSQQGTVTSPTEIDNTGWLKRASDKLATAGMWNPLDVQSALTKYIVGEGLNTKEQAIVNQALKVEGQPPVSLYPGDLQPDQPSTPVPTGVFTPAGNAGVFVRWSDGSLTWVRDPSERDALAKAYPTLNFANPTVKAISDPIWKTSDVYQSQSKDYLNAEKTAKADWAGPGTPSAGTIY
jgi:hypothetical protein